MVPKVLRSEQLPEASLAWFTINTRTTDGRLVVGFYETHRILTTSSPLTPVKVGRFPR